MTTTDNLELELVSGTETFDTDKVMNNFTKIDTAVGNLQDGVGNVESLTTTVKTDLVAAINEVDGNIGDLSGLSTTAKTNLVAAVNELNQNMKWKLAGQTTGSTQLNVNSFLSKAKEFLLIVVFSYNSSNSKARIDHIVNADNFGNALVSGYYYGPNDYVSIGCIISESGYAYITPTWWKVVASGNDIDLSDNTAELFVYYR